MQAIRKGRLALLAGKTAYEAYELGFEDGFDDATEPAYELGFDDGYKQAHDEAAAKLNKPQATAAACAALRRHSGGAWDQKSWAGPRELDGPRSGQKQHPPSKQFRCRY